MASYEDSQLAVQNKGIKTLAEFRKWSEDNKEERLELNIPSTPDAAYKDSGWVDWNTFMGTAHRCRLARVHPAGGRAGKAD
jgi:hypothetical protein